MRADRIPLYITAAMAIMAVPAPAFAAAKPAAKPGVSKPAPAKPGAAKGDDCCKPGADGKKKACCEAKAVDGKKAACCEEMAKNGGKKDACCGGGECGDSKAAGAKKDACCDTPHAAAAGAKKDACCDTPHAAAAGAKKDACCDTPHAAAAGAKKDACCDEGAKGAGKKDACCDAEHPHQMKMDGHHGMKMGGHHGMMVERRIEMRQRKGWRRHFPNAQRTKSHEVRYFAPMGGPNSHILVGGGRHLQVMPWLALGGQMNHALQLNPTAGAGPWVTCYGGFLPKLGFGLGPIRADAGALLGLGTMLRTANVGGMNDVLQARVMWVVEPRVELGWQGEHLGAGLVAGYNYNPNMADFGGPSAGLRFTWKKGMM